MRNMNWMSLKRSLKTNICLFLIVCTVCAQFPEIKAASAETADAGTGSSLESSASEADKTDSPSEADGSGADAEKKEEQTDTSNEGGKNESDAPSSEASSVDAPSQNDPSSEKTTDAATDSTSDASTEEISEEESAVMSLLGTSSSEAAIWLNGKTLSETGSVMYSDPMVLELKNVDDATEISFCYATPEQYASDEWIEWKEGQHPTAIGSYYLAVAYKVSGENYTLRGADFCFQIVKGQLAVPENLKWSSGSTASWDAVTKTPNGGTLDSGAVKEYQVILYKDGTDIKEKTVTGTSCDFTQDIQSEAGIYTFTVQAIPADETLYKESSSSEKSTNTYAAKITLKGDIGVESMSPVNSFILIAGNTAHNTETLTAVPKQGWDFAKWESENAEIEFSDAASASVTVTIKESSDTQITVTANTKDITPPQITKYAAGTGDDYGRILAEATDQGSGIIAYAISTASADSNIAASEWKEQSTLNISEDMKEYSSGNYSLYVKDEKGNIAKSADQIPVTKISYHNYYLAGMAEASFAECLVGTEGELTLAVPSRGGYSFEGWYTAADFSTGAVASFSGKDHNTVSGIDVYGKWTRDPVKIKENPQNISKTYDGLTSKLLVTLEKTYDSSNTVSYQWYKSGEAGKEGTAIEGATDSYYEVKHAADSGFYYVTVSVSIKGEDTEPVKATSSAAEVDIKKADLVMTANSYLNLTYGDPVPSYTYTCSDFAGSDNEENALTQGKGSLSCEYGAENKTGIGTYKISISGFEAPDYTIQFKEGEVKVSPKNASSEDISFTRKDDVPSYAYTGEEIKPDVLITDKNVAVPADSYELKYENCTNVGTASVTATFSGNYTGSRTIEYTIEKADYAASVTITGWVYGSYDPDVNKPEVNINTSGGIVSYHYETADGSEFTGDLASADAGTYKVYAVIEGNSSYRTVTTDKAAFRIEPKTITLTSKTQTWTYDGNVHSYAEYDQEGTFVKTAEGFQNILVSGEIKDVGSEKNEITYTLNSATIASNYNIVLDEQDLIVIPKELSVPSNYHISTYDAGKASWVAISKSGLFIKYILKLYRDSDTDQQVGETIETTDNSYDFAERIRVDSQKGDDGSTPAGHGYYFTIQAVPVSGENLFNYKESEVSSASNELYTAVVTVAKDDGIDHILSTVGGTDYSSAPTYRIVMLQGEKAFVNAYVKNGYGLHEWKCDNTDIKFASANYTATTMQLSDLLTAPEIITVTASSKDNDPYVEEYEAAYKPEDTDYQSVILKAVLWDSLGVAAWQITTASTAAGIDDSKWMEVTPANYVYPELEVTNAGVYYIAVKDTAGNISIAKTPIKIYDVIFDKNSSAATGEMRHILKLENVTITLPENEYVYTGRAIKNWKGESGIYANRGSYAANKDETLVAQWSDEQFTYTVNYYYMDANGKYPAESAPDASKTYAAVYGTEIDATTPAIAAGRSGMKVDSEKSKGSIIITGNNQVFKLYYARNMWTITYTYSIPKTNTIIEKPKAYYYVGQTVTDLEKPTLEGYTFVGWVYGESGIMPSVMPNNNIKATGSFLANDATYQLNYYKQDLTGNSYTMDDALTETINAAHDTSVSVEIKDVKALDGFKAKGITVTYGKAGETEPGDLSEKVDGTVSIADNNKLNINFYYSRNTYRIILNVWKADRSVSTNNLYTKTWDGILYGQTITATDYSAYSNEWTIDEKSIEGYELADYADWSCGNTAPSTMPAGDITVSRDYVATTIAPYIVKVYIQNEKGEYPELDSHIYTYYSNIGKTVRIGSDSSATIDYTSFSNAIDYFSFYELDETAANMLSGKVTDGTKNAELELRIYFKRPNVTTTITYYYGTGQNDRIKFATYIKTGTWGSTYDIEPVKLFKGEGIKSSDSLLYDDVMIDGTKAAEYSFLNNGYIISYTGRYYLNGSYHWPSNTLVTDLDKTYTGTFGQTITDNTYYQNYINVYYTKIDRKNTHFYLDVLYRTMDNPKLDIPLTVTIDDVNYQIRIMNKADIFMTEDTGKKHSEYPGLDTVNLTDNYSYTTLKQEYTEKTYTKTINGEEKSTTCYAVKEGNVNYLCIPDESNQFFLGSFVSYSFQTFYPGYNSVEDYLEKRGNIDIYYSGYSNINMKDNDKLIITFANKNSYTLTYNLGGAYCKSHSYVANDTATSFSCNHNVFPEKEGYTINWYLDSNFVQKAESLLMDGNKMVYGRYEKNTIPVHEYIYYQLANEVKIGPNQYKYITKAELTEAQASLGDELTAKDTTETLADKFTDGAGTDVTGYEIPVKTYYYKGMPVLVDKIYPCLSYSEITMDYSNGARDGFKYDETCTGNVTHGYCQTSAISLEAYYARDTYTITKNLSNTKENNLVTETYRFGQTVTVNAADKKDGYTFNKWDWQKELPSEPGTYSPWTDGAPATAADGSVTFDMPAGNIQINASWTPAEFETTITHYYQDASQTYNTDLAAKLDEKTISSVSNVNIKFSTWADITDGKVYYDGKDILGASFIHGDYTMYFSDATVLDGVAYLDSGDLIAAVQKVKVRSEDYAAVRTYTMSDGAYSMFGFAFARYQYDKSVEILKSQDTDQFQCFYDMKVSYYYTRTSNYEVTAKAFATDGGTAAVTLTGTGTHYYGEKVSLIAFPGNGYTFKGWYDPSEVLVGYSSGSMDGYSLKEELPALEESFKDATHMITISKDVSLVAVVEADPVASPTVTITGTSKYEYGYTVKNTDLLSAKVGEISEANYVAGYQWYENASSESGKTPISGATAATYVFPEGKAAGTYTYSCEVMIGRKDNGRTRNVMSAAYAVTVDKAKMEIVEDEYSGTYDGESHQITLYVHLADNYSIYYSTTELTEQNYITEGSMVNPSFKDVAVKDGVRTQYTVYYYIVDHSGNYKDAFGDEQVIINPVSLTAVESGKAFSRTYDGTAEISGSVIDEGTDKYRLSHDQYYIVSGFVGNESEYYWLDFDALYNNAHVDKANAVTLSDMHVVDEKAITNYNYVFANGTSLSISGAITAMPLKVKWDTETTYTYDGEGHKPSVSIADGQTIPNTGVSLETKGAQVNVGSYKAYATVNPSAADESDANYYATSDYTFDISACAFEISKCPITITPKAKSVTYDGSLQYLTDYDASGLAEGQECKAEMDKGGKDAGTYAITAQNAKIYDANKKFANDNYTITYGSAQLTIQKAPLAVSGITASNKVYDGAKTAVLSDDAVSFAGLVSGDSVSLDMDTVKGEFETDAVGAGKTVAITYNAEDLIGTSAGNYYLNRTDSQQTATADITGALITVTPVKKEVVYGDTSPAFDVTITGVLNEEETEIEAAIRDKVKYLVSRDDAEAAAYVQTLSAGAYKLSVDLTDIALPNYSVSAGEAAELTIQKRPVKIAEAESSSVTKVYDGTLTVPADQISEADYVFDKVENDTLSGIVNGDTLALSNFEAAYNTKNVSSAKKVDPATKVTVSSMVLSNPNYMLSNRSFEIDRNVTITPKELDITAADMEITYGTDAPKYTALYGTDQLVTGDSGTVVYDCAYNEDEAANRVVKEEGYTITPTNFSNENYTMKPHSGKLMVQKADISVTASSAPMNYRATAIPDPSYTTSGYKYGETESSIEGLSEALKAMTYLYMDKSGKSILESELKEKLPGEYQIKGSLTFEAANYKLKFISGTFKITPIQIKVTGIEVKEKAYDGTTAVSADNIDTSQVKYELIGSSFSKTDIENQKDGITATGVYDKPDAGDDRKVTLTIVLNDYLRARYTLAEESNQTLTVPIKAVNLTIAVKDRTIKYGEEAPSFTANDLVFTGFVNKETYTVLGGALKINTDYKKNDPAGEYTITGSGYTSSNYVLASSYTGKLTVLPNQLSAPVPSWSSTSPGSLTWSGVGQIGEVTVDQYVVTLYNGTTKCCTKEVTQSSENLSLDLSSVIRENGAGGYTASVQAIAGTLKNAYKVNVADSEVSSKTAILYAAKVTAVYAADEATTAGKGTGEKPISINGSSSYVMIAGESGAALSAALTNATGYTYHTWISSSAMVTLSGISQTEDTAAVSAEAAMSSKLSSADEVTLTLALQKNSATLLVEIAAVTASAQYNYSADGAPKFTVTAAPKNTDNITATGYTYTYQWQIKKSLSASWENLSERTEATCLVPQGYGAAINTYKVRCSVTATRIDNGESIGSLNSKVIGFDITKAEYKPTVSLSGWTYGESRNVPSVSQNPETAAETFYYSKDDSSWSEKMPTDAGAYYVYCHIAASTNYAEVNTPSIMFVIARTKLDTPVNLAMTSSATSTYGKGTWTAVDAPKENAGTNSQSSIAVTYQVKLYYRETNNDPWALKKTYSNLTDTFVDMTDEIMAQQGNYQFTVQAMSNSTANCSNSEESPQAGNLDISASVKASGDSFTKTYDGTAITLGVNYTGAVASYQWYRNGALINGATDATYEVVYAEQNGKYTCNMIAGGAAVYSTTKAVEITKRNVTVSSLDHSKTYDGTALVGTDADVSISDIADGDVMTVKTGTSITNAGEVSNTISDVVITRNGKTVYKEGEASNNYAVVLSPGSLVINKKSLGTADEYTDGITVAEVAAVTYRGSAYTPAPEVKDSQLATGTEAVLVNAADYTLSYENNLHAGTAAITVTGKGNYTGSIQKTFEINTIALAIKSKDLNKIYDGKVLSGKLEDLEYAKEELAVTDAVTGATFTTSETNAGSYKNEFKDVVITNGSKEDVTKDYTLTLTAGSMVIGRAQDELNITAVLDKTYDGSPVSLSSSGYTRKGSGDVTISYYTNDGTGYTVLNEAPQEQGTYYVQVSAVEAGNYLAVTSSYTKFTIAKRKIALKADNKASVYGADKLEELTYKMEGETVSGESLAIIIRTTAQISSDTGTYPITITYDETMTNYDVSVTAGTYTIGKTVMPLMIKEQTLTYDGEPHGITADNADISPITYKYYEGTGESKKLLSSKPVDAGTYTVEATAAEATNYKALTKSAVLTIEKRQITITADSQEREYNAAALTNAGYKVTEGTIAANDTLTRVSVSGTITDAGETENIPSGAEITRGGSNVSGKDYTIQYVNGKLRIIQTAGMIAITGDPAKIYDGTAVKDPQMQRSGLGQVRYIYYKTEAAGAETQLGAAPVHAGNYAVRAVLAETANYSAATSDEKVFTISKRKVTVTAVGASSAYQAPIAEVTAKITEGIVVVGDDLHISAVTDATSMSPASSTVYSYKVTPTYTENPDYNVTLVEADYTITKGNLPFVSTDRIETYDKKAHSISLASTVPGLAVYYSEEPLDSSNYQEASQILPQKTEVGEYTIYFYLTAPNYEDTNGSAKIRLNKAEQPIEIKDAVLSYNGKGQTIAAFNENISPISYQYYEGSGENKKLLSKEPVIPGIYTVEATGEDTANYKEGTTAATLTIVPRKITIAAGSDEKTYDGTMLTETRYLIFGEGLAQNQIIKEIKIDGSQIGVGTTKTSASDAKIVYIDEDGTEVDVTSFYDISYQTGSLTIHEMPPTESGSDGGSNVTVQQSVPLPVPAAGASAGKSIPAAGASDGSSVIDGMDVSMTGDSLPEGNAITEGRQTDNSAEAIARNDATAENSIVDTGEGASADSANSASTALSALSVGGPGTEADRVVVQEESVQLGDGSVSVIVESAKEADYTLEGIVVDTQAVISACLTEEEQAQVEQGSKVEIRLLVEKKPDSEVTEEEKQEISATQKEMAKQIKGLTFGQYVDIQLDKRIDEGDWDSIPEASDNIDIIVDIPVEIQYEGATYYIIRDHNGSCSVLYNLMQSYTKMKISTRYFSTYAILYTQEDTEVTELMKEADSCLYHIYIVVACILCILLLFLMRRKKEKKEEKKKDNKKDNKKVNLYLSCIVSVAAILIYILLAYLGSCSLDLPAAVCSTLVTLLVLWLSQKKRKDREKEKEV